MSAPNDPQRDDLPELNQEGSGVRGLAWLFDFAYARPIRVFWVIALICLGLALVDFFYEKHGHYAVEEFPVAYGIFGFVCFVFIVYVGKWLRHLVMRDEDYYDR